MIVVLDNLLVDAKYFDLEAAEFFIIRAETLGNRISGNGRIFLHAFADLLNKNLPIPFRHRLEMLVLTVEMQVFKVQEIVRFGDLADDDIVAVVDVFCRADFYHLDVAERTVVRALTYRKAAVAEIHQHLASLQVVPCEWLGEVSLGCMCQDQQGKVVHAFQSFQVLHQWQRIFCPLVLVTEVGDVVDDHDLGTGFDDQLFNRIAE